MGIVTIRSMILQRQMVRAGSVKVLQLDSFVRHATLYNRFVLQIIFPISDWNDSQVHPDKFGQNSQREKEFSEQHSSYLNNAYRTLRDPFLRASYLLGVSVGDEEKSEKATDSQLAMDMMELHEEIDDLSDANELESKLAEVQSELDRLFSHLGKYLENGNTEEARKTLDRIRFFITAKRAVCGKLGRNRD
ncbi:co-chaperone protein HscB like protein [Ditylenchus destructor]|uniref:Co-chaperone protein HscB like protein n=1 Tax=Ditylenchus destructor TaxID=166010 RepID=A0AAD4N8Q0_9BILA|nr:co-chaperone protein HscB like protein [Ditylenchus destructor]